MTKVKPGLIILTFLTLVAFAANSLFCRMALSDPDNDPGAFTMVRLISGAVALLPFFIRRRPAQFQFLSLASFPPALCLFTYALFFSMAYVLLNTGTGALLLFASVQLTMMAIAFSRGDGRHPGELIGFFVALSGFVWLVSPGISMPPLAGTFYMILSGIAWGAYTLLGQRGGDPVFSTARNFLWTIPFVGATALAGSGSLSPAGLLWAVLSGALTSGMGYVLWYTVLKDLKTSTAAILQLSVPAIAAFAGAGVLGETITFRLAAASVLIFAGIGIKIKWTPA